ncbi:hypothetical protein F4804DRAFT_298590 [Jackrogersella minutella]|nr:hypothetical protein F4804DRAFT_298590 [Jackrogersella minutella]
MAPRGNITPRTIMAPAAAFTMACLLFTYTRITMKEAKRNAKSVERSRTRSRVRRKWLNRRLFRRTHRFSRHFRYYFASRQVTGIVEISRCRVHWWWWCIHIFVEAVCMHR